MPFSGDIFDYTTGTAPGPVGTVVSPTKVGQRNDDVKNALNTPVSIPRGGTGGITAVQASDNLVTESADIASATTTDLSTATGVHVTITGTTTITGLGTEQAGAIRKLTFADALVLTHNATSLIIPGGANITTAAGDVAEVVSLGSGNWRVINYQKANGEIIVLTVSSDDAGSVKGPALDLYRNSASPANNDFIGSLEFSGESDAGNKVVYARLGVKLKDVTDGSEDGIFQIRTTAGGVEGNVALSAIGTDINIFGIATVGDIDTSSNSTRGAIINNSSTNCVTIQLPSTVTSSNSAFRYYQGSTLVMRVKGTGDLANANNAYGALSDERLKSNIETAKSQWNDVKAFRLVNYNLDKYADDDGVFREREDKPRHLGLSAQEAEKVSPGIVDTDDNGVKSVTYSLLYLKAVGALQEAMSRIEALEAKVDKLSRKRMA